MDAEAQRARIADRSGMLEGFLEQPPVGEPAGRAAVQGRCGVRRVERQLASHDLAERVVVAVPGAAGVETLPWTLMPLALSPFTGALGGRIGSRPLVIAGLLLLAAGTLI